MVALRHHAKFSRSHSNRSRDMAIYLFFMTATVRHIGFVVGNLGQPTTTTWWSLSLCEIWLESIE